MSIDDDMRLRRIAGEVKTHPLAGCFNYLLRMYKWQKQDFQIKLIKATKQNNLPFQGEYFLDKEGLFYKAWEGPIVIDKMCYMDKMYKMVEPVSFNETLWVRCEGKVIIPSLYGKSGIGFHYLDKSVFGFNKYCTGEDWQLNTQNIKESIEKFVRILEIANLNSTGIIALPSTSTYNSYFPYGEKTSKNAKEAISYMLDDEVITLIL